MVTARLMFFTEKRLNENVEPKGTATFLSNNATGKTPPYNEISIQQKSLWKRSISHNAPIYLI